MPSSEIQMDIYTDEEIANDPVGIRLRREHKKRQARNKRKKALQRNKKK